MAEGDGGIRTNHRPVVTAADLVPGHPAGGGHAPEVLKDAATEIGHVVEIIGEGRFCNYRFLIARKTFLYKLLR